MNYGRKTPSMGTPSVYSHVTSRSTANLKSARSVRSIKIPWYQKPIVENAIILDLQRAALLIAFYSIFFAVFSVITSIFDIYCLAQAAPGSVHYGYYIFSYQFVYVGNVHVRNTLIVFALFSIIGGMITLVTGIILVMALRKEYERKMLPWLYSFFVFGLFKIFSFIFAAIVNDKIFGYNITMCFLYILFSVVNVYGWILVYSLYLELADLTKLEDVAHLRMGTMASLNASTCHSLAGSRPTTPHSTVSTAPVM